MSQISTEFLKTSIEQMLTTNKKRNFLETVELQVGLRDYDPDKRFKGSTKLNHRVHNKIRVIIKFILGLCYGKCSSY
jgi:hypothetical protein